MARLTLLQAAAYAARQVPRPLTPVELWQAMVDQELHLLIRCGAKNPAQSVNQVILGHLREDPNPFFVQASQSPVRFLLLADMAPIPAIGEEIQRIRSGSLAPAARKSKWPFKERDLHPFLSHFAYHGMDQVYTRTIFHEVSRRGYGQWIHPDIVGFRYPFDQGHGDLISVMGGPDQVLTLVSYELKRHLHLGNLRESFFQAVSNSSWAHEGYLVAPVVEKSDVFLSELERLVTSFGIGVIELCLEDPTQSAVLFSSRIRPALDFAAANKLANENPDFAGFLKNVRIDVGAGYVHTAEYDPILRLPDLNALYEGWLQAAASAAALPPSVGLPGEPSSDEDDIEEETVPSVPVPTAEARAVVPLRAPQVAPLIFE